MITKIKTEPASEPITKAQLELHLKLDSGSATDNHASTQSIAPGSHIIAAAYSLVGSSVDVLGKTAIVYLEAGTNGVNGTVDVKIQESDDNATWTDVTDGAFAQVTTANDNATYEKEYTGLKQYIRVVATVAAAACEFGISVVTDAATAAEDDLLDDLITTVRQRCEEITNRALITQTWYVYLSEWPKDNFIELPKSPVQTITGIKYKGTDGTWSTWSTGYYVADTDSDPCRVWLDYGESWPVTSLHPVNPIQIEQVCGYGTSTDVPKKLQQGMLLDADNLYVHRGEEDSPGVPQASLRLYDSYRIFSFGG